jgi:hypothetical protein
MTARYADSTIFSVFLATATSLGGDDEDVVALLERVTRLDEQEFGHPSLLATPVENCRTS